MNQLSTSVLLVEIDCTFPMAQSLKQKRRVLKSAIEKLKQRFNISIIESGYQDKWQRSMITFCAVSTNRSSLQAMLPKIETLLDTIDELQVGQIELHWL